MARRFPEGVGRGFPPWTLVAGSKSRERRPESPSARSARPGYPLQHGIWERRFGQRRCLVTVMARHRDGATGAAAAGVAPGGNAKDFLALHPGWCFVLCIQVHVNVFGFRARISESSGLRATFVWPVYGGLLLVCPQERDGVRVYGRSIHNYVTNRLSLSNFCSLLSHRLHLLPHHAPSPPPRPPSLVITPPPNFTRSLLTRAARTAY